jgi:hypothetical protein
MSTRYQLPGSSPFARTNRQTIAQRVTLLRELLPSTESIGELCCGDCSRQAGAYWQAGINRYVGLDISAEIVTANRAKKIDCVQGDVLDPQILRQFLEYTLLFFGPPLSVGCDGHRGLSFARVVPGYAEFSRRLWLDLGYQGTVVYICPNSTTPADVRQVYQQIHATRPDVGLRLVWQSWSTETGLGEVTGPRLKYIEAWFSAVLPDMWEFRGGHDSG